MIFTILKDVSSSRFSFFSFSRKLMVHLIFFGYPRNHFDSVAFIFEKNSFFKKTKLAFFFSLFLSLLFF